MEFPWILDSPPFHHMLRASGQSEVWSDERAEDKFRQYGWRCSTSEDAYSPGTLIGNWFEQRRDIKRHRRLRPLPSQFSHYFETTYSSSFQQKEKIPIYNYAQKEPRGSPSHQPELNPPIQGACYHPTPATTRSCYHRPQPQPPAAQTHLMGGVLWNRHRLNPTPQPLKTEPHTSTPQD